LVRCLSSLGAQALERGDQMQKPTNECWAICRPAAGSLIRRIIYQYTEEIQVHGALFGSRECSHATSPHLSFFSRGVQIRIQKIQITACMHMERTALVPDKDRPVRVKLVLTLQSGANKIEIWLSYLLNTRAHTHTHMMFFSRRWLSERLYSRLTRRT
jgi:hypothetical protein